jgi:hypothetical protein
VIRQYVIVTVFRPALGFGRGEGAEMNNEEMFLRPDVIIQPLVTDFVRRCIRWRRGRQR